MKIAINPGHTIEGKGTGAIGFLSETTENRKIAKRVIEMLRARGNEVIDCTINKSENDLAEAVKKANDNNVDLFCSIHLNSGGGYGTETYVYKFNGVAESLARKLNDAVVKSCDFKNRGVKEGNFYVLRNTKAPAILLEVCFVDSKEDCKKLNVEAVAKAIANSIENKEEDKNNYNAEVINVNSYLNVRDNPNGKIIGKLFNNERVKAFEIKEEFIRVKYDTSLGSLSKEGWCSKDYIKLDQVTEIYRVRKTWTDIKSQLGAFNNLDNAKKVARENNGYKVFNSMGKEI